MKKSILTFAVIIIIATLGGAAFFSLNQANTRDTGATTDLAKLQEDYNDLQAKYYALMGNYSTLEYNYQSILLQNPYSLVPNPASSGTADTQQVLSRYMALQQMYVNLQVEYNQYVSDYLKLKSLTDQRLMQGDLRSLVTPKDPEVVSLTYNITGKIGNITDPNAYFKDIKAIYNWVNENIKYRDDGLYPILPDNPGLAAVDG
jgi:hypothetical protein